MSHISAVDLSVASLEDVCGDWKQAFVIPAYTDTAHLVRQQRQANQLLRGERSPMLMAVTSSLLPRRLLAFTHL